jgi:hypothetical protein
MRCNLALGFVLLVLTLGCGGGTPESGGTAPAAETAAAAAGDGSGALAPIIQASTDADAPDRILDPRADELLRAMAKLLAGSKAFAFEAEERFDEIPSGQPRALLSNLRRVAVQRPNRFAADAEGDTLSRSVWFDGENVSVYDRTQNTYARIPASGSIDNALDTLAEKYAATVPLADLLYSDPYAVLNQEVTYSKYLGLHRAAGVLCHHLVFAQPTIEWQIWIESGDQPLPRQLVITYVREPGEPQYTAVLTKWRMTQAIPDNLFRFEAPEGAQRVDAASLVPRQPGVSE